MKEKKAYTVIVCHPFAAIKCSFPLLSQLTICKMKIATKCNYLQMKIITLTLCAPTQVLPTAQLLFISLLSIHEHPVFNTMMANEGLFGVTWTLSYWRGDLTSFNAMCIFFSASRLDCQASTTRVSERRRVLNYCISSAVSCTKSSLQTPIPCGYPSNVSALPTWLSWYAAACSPHNIFTG